MFLLQGVPIVIIRRSIGHCERSPDLLDVTVGTILQRSETIDLVILLKATFNPYNKNYGQCSIFDSWSANNAYIYMKFSANLVYLLFV